MTDQEIIEKAKNIAACVPFIDDGAGVVETQQCIHDLIKRIRVLGEEVEAGRGRLGPHGLSTNCSRKQKQRYIAARAATDAARRGA